MKFGLNIPVRHNTDGDTMREFCVSAEALGFESLWIGDHVVIPDTYNSDYPYRFRFDPDLKELFPDPGFAEPCTLLAFAAGCTKRVRLGTGVLIPPMRNPLVLAKQLATLSVTSNGRCIAGIGVGWLKEEFEALNAPFEQRGARTDEYVEIMRKLWSSETPVGHEGKFYSFEPVRFKPRPVGNAVPIWIGGHTEAALKRTARYADGWYAVELPPEEFERCRGRLLQLWEEYGREGEPEIACCSRLKLTGDDLSATVRQVEAYRKAGCEHLVTYATTKRPGAENIERMERLHREVVAEFATT